MWGERLKMKKSREKFLSPWAERIAEAARKGASGQQELQWDSYDKIKESWKLAAVQAKAKAKEKRAGTESESKRSKAKEQKIKGRERRVAHCSRVKTQGEIDKGNLLRFHGNIQMEIGN